MNQRLKHAYTALKDTGIECLIVFSSQNITYLTGYRSRDSFFILSERKNIYITDARYTQEAKQSLAGYGCLVKQTNGSPYQVIARSCAALGLRSVGFEEKYLSVSDHKKLQDAFNNKINLVPAHGIVEELRQIKDGPEVQKIKKAAHITLRALEFARNLITPGNRELEIAAELERFIRYNGAYASSFDIIVASGPNSAFPHHITSARRICKDEPVVIDMGVDYEGYKSDLTRVFFSGRISSTVRKIYDIVLAAQDRAIRNIKPGVFIKKIDLIARHYITKRGYGGFFSHSLGHGVGLEVHEAPRISQKENHRLKDGMVFTVEPAIYLPRRFGIRIEDMVRVTRKGCEVISGTVNQ